MKKIILGSIVFLSSFILSACTTKNVSQNNSVPAVPSESVSSLATTVAKCNPGSVAIEGYGDKGKRLANCFVEYPGEPSRQDKSYYIVEDICGQFTKEFIGNALGKNIIKTEPAPTNSIYGCSYYTSDKDYVMLVLDYLKITNQQKYYESDGDTVKSESFIPMRNLVVYQPNEEIKTLYWVLGDEKFISIERSVGSPLTTQEIQNFAANVGQAIKSYK